MTIFIRDENGGWSRNQQRTRLATDADKAAYAAAWAEFQAKHPDPADGTPITYLPGVTPAILATLSGAGVRTLEQLAAATVSGIDDAIVRRARAYLAAVAEPMTSPETSQFRAAIAAEAPQPRRGRPRKAQLEV